MGCFLACFGLSNKRKRPKSLYKVLTADQKYGNYEALAIIEKPIVPYSDFRDRNEGKEQTSAKSAKSRKKVRFNLNVQIYEPNPTDYQILDNKEEANENTTAETEESAALAMRYPSNYRYYNCRDGYDEDDEIAYEEYDFDDYEDDEFDDEDDGDSDESLDNNGVEVYDQNTRQKELSEPCYSSVAEDRIKNQILFAANDTDLKSNFSERDRSIRMHSVMSPVENLTQWKAMKAKVASSKHRRLENVPSAQKISMPLVSETSLNFTPFSLESNVLQSKPLLPEIAVDASLSNWLISPNSDVSKTTIHCQ